MYYIPRSERFPLSWSTRGLFLLIFVVVVYSTPLFAASNEQWAGEWKENYAGAYTILTISQVDDGGFTFNYDQGVGINGASLSGRAKFGKAIKNKRFASTTINGSQRNFTLTLHKKRLQSSLQFDPGPVLTVVDFDGPLNLIRTEKPVYYNTSFNCNKAETPVEISLCTNKLLASLDQQLGATYRALRKKVKKSTLKSAQKKWIQERDKGCVVKKKVNIVCLQNSYATRILELAMFPSRINSKGIPFTWMEEKFATTGGENSQGFNNEVGYFIDGNVTRGELGQFTLLRKYTKDKKLTYEGCFEPDRSLGYDPQRMDCNYQIMISFYPPNRLVVAKLYVRDKDVRITAPMGLKTKEQLPEFMKAWIKSLAEPANVSFNKPLSWAY